MQPLKILFNNRNINFQNRVDYVLKFIENHSLTNGMIQFIKDKKTYSDLSIEYGAIDTDVFSIPAQGLFFSNKIFPFELLNANQYFFDSIPVYSVEKEKREQNIFFKNNCFQFDIIEAIFFHISRMEEWYCEEGNLDEWDMMYSTEQFLVKHQIHHLPVVDHLVFAFAKALGIKIIPQKSFIRITHDIDEVKYQTSLLKSIRSSAGIIWRRQNWTSIFQIWASYLSHQKNEYDTFDWLLSNSTTVEKYIYFLVGGNTKHDTPYDLTSKRMKDIFSLCKQQNYHIGIHPSYNSWRDKKMFAMERAQLEKQINIPVEVSRQHYLHFDFKTTPKILDQLKIKEDSTMGFNDRIGFRAGTGFGYHLYDFENEKPFSFIETPLVFMDSALLNETNYDLEKTTALWNAFLEKNEFHTKITFNFHNTRFYDAKIHDIPLKKWYQELLLSTASNDHHSSIEL